MLSENEQWKTLNRTGFIFKASEPEMEKRRMDEPVE